MKPLVAICKADVLSGELKVLQNLVHHFPPRIPWFVQEFHIRFGYFLVVPGHISESLYQVVVFHTAKEATNSHPMVDSSIINRSALHTIDKHVCFPDPSE